MEGFGVVVSRKVVKVVDERVGGVGVDWGHKGGGGGGGGGAPEERGGGGGRRATHRRHHETKRQRRSDHDCEPKYPLLTPLPPLSSSQWALTQTNPLTRPLLTSCLIRAPVARH